MSLLRKSSKKYFDCCFCKQASAVIFSAWFSPLSNKLKEAWRIFRLNKQNKADTHAQKNCTKTYRSYFSSPIQTILSVLESHQILRRNARGLYRRSGISPCPEELIFNLCHHYNTKNPEFQGFSGIFDNANFFRKIPFFGVKTHILV